MKLVLFCGLVVEFFVLVLSQYNNPLKNPYVCGIPSCPQIGDHKFDYSPGRYYTYKYSVEARSIFNGTSKNESTLFIDSDVTLNFLTPCDGLLTLSDITLSEIAPSDNIENPTMVNSQLFSDMISEYSIRFAFKDGVISEICPEKEEKSWALNFKRGILSLLQNSMKRLDLDFNGDEVDVRGLCSTNYKVLGAKEASWIIEKTKNLDTCLDRTMFHSVIQFTDMKNFKSRSKNQDILNSSNRCRISVDHKIYNEISCEENFSLEPFSNNAASATTVVKQNLVLLEEGEQKLIDQEKELFRRENLKFDYSIAKQPLNGNLKTTRNLIKKLCKESEYNSQTAFSDLFGKFIYELRTISYPALSSLYSHSRMTCEDAKKHLLDAIPFVSTPASVKLMKDIILSKSLPTNIMEDWMLALSFITNPDEDILKSVMEILQNHQFTTKIALSVSALTHRYCSINLDCESSESVQAIVQHFENFLLNLTQTTIVDHKTQEQMIVTLKALSTIGLISKKFDQELFKLVEDHNLDMSIRIAAVETFRRLPCEKSRSYFESIFKNQDEDTEVRIASYLQMMKCPTYLLIRSILSNLRNEEVNQVGAFVWSHLHNILKSANPLKIEIQSLLSEADLMEKFNTDIRKFSHNTEGSLYFDEYGFGGNYETNIVFSPSSYIPRTAMLNLTFDIFGKSVNLFEVHGRAEGFERYLQSLFGPTSQMNVLKDKIDEYKSRWTRSMTDNKNSIENNIKSITNDLKKEKVDPKVALGLKIFGNDVNYATFNGMEDIRQGLQTLNVFNYLKQVLSGKEINYKKATLFLDTNYVVATGAGLPLFLSALGTGSVNIKLFGSFKTAGYSKNKEIDLVANLEPTASTDVSAEMSLNAFYSSTGIKLKANMQSFLSVKADLKIKGTKLVSVKFNLPKKTAKLFAARSEILVKQNNVEVPQKGIMAKKVSNSLCSWPAISDILGLQLCLDYNFKNSSNIFAAPYSILAGPASFQLYLQKSDPTANIFLFEYKWTQGHDTKVLSLTFDTPGAKVKRLIHANYTVDNISNNMTVLIESSAGTVLTRGRMKNTDDEKYLQVTLDINEKKHFDSSISYARLRKINGYVYKPRIYLGINGDRVLELQGSVDLISKKDISQYTVDIKFHTKRLTSKLFGYISQAESSVGADLYLDYKFTSSKEQRLTIKFSVANRSRKNLAVILAGCEVHSTAYDSLNFNGNITFQKSGSHLEFKTIFVQYPLPPDHPQSETNSLRFDFIFTHKTTIDSKQLIKAVTTLKRKSTNLDIEGIVLYESINSDINLECSLKYGDNKYIAVTMFWSHPRTTLEEIKARLNITIPTFTPMLLRVEISEKLTKDYKLDISGTWFSGHSADAVGFYQDKSSTSTWNHHIKLFIKSPNFKDINTDFLLYRDNDEFKVDIKAIHNEQDYQILLKHNNTSETKSKSYAKLKYRNKQYWLDMYVNKGDYYKIATEIHLDNLRDIEFSLWIFNEATQKELGFDINWDANRDPNQKLLVAANFTKAADFNYNADLIVSYPGRTIIGKYQFVLQKGQIDTLATISWDDNKSFSINLNIIYRYESDIYLEILASVNTPLDTWRNTKIKGIFDQSNNNYNFHAIVTMNPRQKIVIDIIGNSAVLGSYIDCRYSCSIQSTLDNVPNINTTISHFQNGSNFNTNVHLMYNINFVIDVDSKWLLESNKKFSNFTGTVKTLTPFRGLEKGFVVAKFYYTNDKHLRGVAEIDLDQKTMLVDMEGKFKKIMDSMFIANVSTLDEKYQCKFKLSKKEKHFVALLSYPTGNLGTEVLLSLNNLTDFDIKLLLATPMDFLQNLVAVAKLQSGEANFRIGWNSLLLGFAGVWHYVNIIDFEYSYKIYTPITDFEENGLVGKLILKEGLDFEISLMLSLYKLGVKLIGKPKPKPFKELEINVGDVYSSKPNNLTNKKNDDFLSWKGLIELDAIIYPTMKGQLEIDQKGTVYILRSKIDLPHGLADIFDEFEYIDILTMSNYLTITTPYESYKTLKSNFKLNVVQNASYLFLLNFSVENRTNIVKTGVLAEYNTDQRNVDERIYNATLEVNTPFKAFPKLNLFGAFETERNFYRTKLLFNTNRSDISLDATMEIHDRDDGGSWAALNSNFFIITPIIVVPQCYLNIIKLLSPNDNYITVRLKVPEKLKSEVYFKTSWLIKYPNRFKSVFELESPFLGFENTTAGLDFLSTDVKLTFSSYVHIKPIEIELNSTLEDNVFSSSSLLYFKENRIPVNIKCKIIVPSPNQREFNGTLLLKDKVYKINGNASLTPEKIPVKVLITFIPGDNGPSTTFQYNLESTLKGHELVGSLSYSNKLIRFHGDATGNDKFNWKINLQVSPPNIDDKFSLHAISTVEHEIANLDIVCTTQIPKLENPKFGASYSLKGLRKMARGYFELAYVKGSADIEFIWIYLENMFLRAIGRYENTDYSSSSTVEMYYENPNKKFEELNAGGNMKIDRFWEAGANASLKFPEKNNITLEGHLKIPNDFKEVHSLFGKLNYEKSFKFIDYLIKYRCTYPSRKYGSWAQIFNQPSEKVSSYAVVEWDGQEFRNNLNLTLIQPFHLLYKLKTPKYPDKQFFVANVNYENVEKHHNLTYKTFYPEDKLLSYGTIDYLEVANMYGMFNVSLPYKSLNFTGIHFKTETNGKVYNRFIKALWANNSAILDSKCNITIGSHLQKNYKGNMVVEIPLTTRHIGLIDYEYDKKSELSTGHATVEYNGENVLEGKYNCLSKSQADSETDTIHVELLNKMVPIGADYVHRHEIGTPREGYNAPTVDNKHLHVYHLKNRTNFNITGELMVKTHSNGQSYIISATHLNRTVKLWASYSIFLQEYKQQSRLQLSPEIWIEYDLSLINKTVDETFDCQKFIINMSYPRRNFTFEGLYNVSDSIISTDMFLVWGNDSKSVEASLDWKRISIRREQLELLLKHPTFQRDVSFLTTYDYGNASLNGKLIIDYSTNPDKRVSLIVNAKDKSKEHTYNYTYNIWAEHNATNLHLNAFGHVLWSPIKYGLQHIVDYQRSYLDLLRSMNLANIDLNEKEAYYKKQSITGESYFWGKYEGNYPIYTANITTSHGINHTSGKCYLNFHDKLLYINVNLTEDGSQSLHTYGIIPDSRSARFDMWKHYDDKRLTDVSYYLKLNHSRLITSKLIWRPELITDMQSGVRSKIKQLYNEALEEINTTRQYLRSEFISALNGMWQDAKPIVNQYLIDLRNLTVIEEDFDYMKIFLNTSYYNNEFYIKDITSIIWNLFDEMSLKTHLQNLPKIFQELSTILGDSGKNIKQSIAYFIEKIKLYYANTTEFIHDLINGDPVNHITNMLEKLVNKYDDFIKNLHVTVLQYMERLYSESYNLVLQNWHQTLAALEPTFLKFVHYLETIIWTTGKEFLDFLYIRRNKIIESAYFMEFTKFSRDVDRFYKDITGNNTLEAIYKYSSIGWNFVNEKYINHVPFGKELKAIVFEIWAEVKQLGDISPIKYIIEEYYAILDTVKYYYKYLEVEFRVHRFLSFVYRKLTEMSVTALEKENKQREAKTKFVYDPNEGLMLLEQKIPFSWHAFNETPRFKELPEIKIFYDAYDYLSTSETSFWKIYHDYKQYTDLSEWLPPFNGHAIFIGGMYYVTFDKKFYEFRGICTYLLATDIVDRNFTLLADYDDSGISKEIIVLLNRTKISINLFKDEVQIQHDNAAPSNRLPTEVSGVYIYREADVIFVENIREFTLKCNIKFQLCVFDISGWHYARTTGLLGTYNNEPHDDLITPNQIKSSVSDLSRFGDSLSVNKICPIKTFPPATQIAHTLEIQQLCNEFFHSKVSDLSTCFARVAKEDYWNMCISSSTPKEACRSAISYVEMCHRENTPVNIPDSCIKCTLLNGTEIKEGEFIRLQGSAVPRMADIVFIVEAKKCNKDLKNHKNFNILLDSINQELLELNITNNRYAVVVFGGNGVFNGPRSIIRNSKTFTDSNSVFDYFDDIQVGNGNSDIYRAITFANKLIFRPGVPRNFILLPCSECQEHNMQFDYSVMHNLLFEKAVSLHILLNTTFNIPGEFRKKESKIPFGVDLNKAYTKKDTKKLDGDQVLRDSIKIPKSTLGMCFSLALETNGTVFSTKYLETEKNARNLATVFAKRFALSALPSDCTDCECASLHNGVSFMDCYLCTYPRSLMEHHNYYEDEENF